MSKGASYTGTSLSEAEVEEYIRGRYAFVNVWRNITDAPVQVKPLAVCDTNSVDPATHINYKMEYPERTGSNLCLAPDHAADHKWYYYPHMEKEECLLFYVFN